MNDYMTALHKRFFREPDHLTKLTSRNLQKLYKDLTERGRVQTRSGKGNPGLSSTTVRSVHLTLHCAFERAVKERLIPRNSTDDCIAPKVWKVEMKTLLPEHLKDYLYAASARNVLPMFYLELVSGLRKGELFALLWSDLDVENKTIFVSKQYVRNPSREVMLSRPKTETSVRQVSIPQDAVDLLIQEHSKHPDNPYIFPSPVMGEMYHPDSVVKLHEKDFEGRQIETHPVPRPQTHFRDAGTPKWSRRENHFQYAGSLRCGIYPLDLHPCHQPAAKPSGGNDGEFYGTGHVTNTTGKKPSRKAELPVWHSLSLSGHFRVWVTVWINRKARK